MKDYKLWEQMQREVKVGNVNEHVNGDLHLFKYTPECHHDDKWNKWNIQARGLIMKSDGTIVARPFNKFFNIGERKGTQSKYLPWRKGYTVWEKMDGSCGVGYMMDGAWRLATPGSTESDQAAKGTEMLTRYNVNRLTELCADATPVFEIVYPDNRIVLDYKGEYFLCLLAIFDHNGTEWPQGRVSNVADECGFRRPQIYDIELDRDTEIPFEETMHEGYVILFNNGMRVKAKDPRYVKIHRLLDAMSLKGVIGLLRENCYGVHISVLPKDLQKSFDDIRSLVMVKKADVERRIDEYFRELSSKHHTLESRKEIALWIQNNIPSEFWGFMFGKLDSKDMTDNIWKFTINELNEEK